jgi:putative DNA primase/helicase
MPLDMLPPAEPSPIDNAELALLPRNDAGNARRLLARHGHEMAWVPEIGWLVWDGRRWAADGGEEAAYARAEATAEAIYDEADELPGEQLEGADGKKKPSKRQGHRNWALTCGNVTKINAMLKAAQSRMRCKRTFFDAHPQLLNVENGTLELGDEVRLRKHEPVDRMTRMAAVTFDREASCPRWRAFIDTILPDPETQLFVQKWLGYCLTGNISEQCFLIWDGKGSNGKSTTLETIARIMGDYAGNVPIESFMHAEGRKGSEASPDLARLPGVRLIRTSEPEQGARLSESRIKQWTGGEEVSARKLHRDIFDFTPSGKITMSVNARPRVAGKDEGTRSRILVVPFKHRFERRAGGRKHDFVGEFIAKEASGILNWLLDGFRMWNEDGLKPPAQVIEATDEMFREQDPIGVAVKEIFIHTGKDEHKVQASAAYDAFVVWCKRNAIEPKSKTAFGTRLRDLDYRKKAMTAGTFYVGVEIHTDYLPVMRGHGGDGDA